jgi:hypothetical protein
MIWAKGFPFSFSFGIVIEDQPLAMRFQRQKMKENFQ